MDASQLSEIDLDRLDERQVRRNTSQSRSWPLGFSQPPLTDGMAPLRLPPTPTKRSVQAGRHGEEEPRRDGVAHVTEPTQAEMRAGEENGFEGAMSWLCWDPMLGNGVVANANGVGADGADGLGSAANMNAMEYAMNMVLIGGGGAGVGNGTVGEVGATEQGGAVRIAPRPDGWRVGVEKPLFYSTAPCTPQMGTLGTGAGSEEEAETGWTGGEAEDELGAVSADEVAGVLRKQQFESMVRYVEKHVLDRANRAKLQLRDQMKRERVPGNSREAKVTRLKQKMVREGYRDWAMALLRYAHRQQGGGRGGSL